MEAARARQRETAAALAKSEADVTMIGKGEDAKWVGSPLRVHRRCLQPMFAISNAIAYDGMMVHGDAGAGGGTGTGAAGADDPWFGESCWIDIAATDPRGNLIPAPDVGQHFDSC